jgi:hypothetical protein
MNAISIISDTAVTVEELNVSGEHAEVISGLTRLIIDGCTIGG